MEKLQKANKELKYMLSKEFDKDTWVYIDFVIEDRFYWEVETEIKEGNIDISRDSVDDIVEYAYNKIVHWYRNSLLFWF